MGKTVDFTEEAVLSYLDECINFWRNKRDKEEDPMAIYYIDAFQSVRISIFGDILP
ncbi:MAG: hypothetical protein P1S46_06180 [bacterium]|nr:hypothetical protein [bacterium]